jgi:hypothetical protein
MDSAVLLLRLALAAVFVVAAVGKLADLRGSRAALVDFGVPSRVAVVAGALLPLAELTIAVALIPVGSARWGAGGALVLLASFVGGIARALSQGRAPDCHCFGQIHSAPAGWGALARNVVLAAVAVTILWKGPGPAVGAWLSARSGLELLATTTATAAAALALLALRLWTDNRRLRRELAGAPRERGLPVGVPAPPFALPDAEGQTRTLEALRAAGHSVALVFMSANCGPCTTLIPELKRWQVSLSGALTISVIGHGSNGDGYSADGYEGLANVLVQRGSEVSDAYRIPGTPSAVVVSPGGAIASPPAIGAPAIEALIRVTLQRDG